MPWIEFVYLCCIERCVTKFNLSHEGYELYLCMHTIESSSQLILRIHVRFKLYQFQFQFHFNEWVHLKFLLHQKERTMGKLWSTHANLISLYIYISDNSKPMRLAVKDWLWVTKNTTFLLLLLLLLFFAAAEESIIWSQCRWNQRRRKWEIRRSQASHRSQSLIGSSIPAGSERRHQSLLSPSPRVHRASVTTRWRWQDLVLVGPTRVSNGVDPLKPSFAPHHAAPNPDLRGLNPSPGNSPRDQMDLCVRSPMSSPRRSPWCYCH